MDLNQLLYHHQIALMQDSAECGEGSRLSRTMFGSRFNLVSHYGKCILRNRRELGVEQSPGWLVGPKPSFQVIPQGSS